MTDSTWELNLPLLEEILQGPSGSSNLILLEFVEGLVEDPPGWNSVPELAS
jgi:hypothetical protein